MVSKIPLFLQSTWKGGQWAGRWEAQQSMGSSPEQQQHGKASRLTRVASQWTVDSIAQKLGKNQGLFQGAGSRPATPSPTPDTVLSREQVCYSALRECPRLKNTHAYSIAEPGRHPPAQLS